MRRVREPVREAGTGERPGGGLSELRRRKTGTAVFDVRGADGIGRGAAMRAAAFGRVRERDVRDAGVLRQELISPFILFFLLTFAVRSPIMRGIWP